ncbi:MAG: tetratricopeptide repeat protein [Elusimicrobia bacterium]|nr:tetratricopeptide repeat protein [Elusimicrobiota bacterium]
MQASPRTPFRPLIVAALALLAAVLFALPLLRRRAPAPPPSQPAFTDTGYWYLDIYDPFFARETGPDGRARYVTRRPFARRTSFPVEKSSDTFRVFVIGGSVAAQYDSAPARIPGRTLQDVLGRLLPGRQVEVVHCGMGAYDSYREKLVADEIVRYAPDLFVLMSGNNEMRTDAAPPSARLILALRLRRWLGRPYPPRAPDRAARLPATLPPSFAQNLRAMVRAARRAGAATVLCTLPRRLDNPPPDAIPAWLWRPENLKIWDFSGKREMAAAAGFWRGHIAQRSDDLGHFHLARSLRELGDASGARREFAAAKVCRAPWDANPVIRETAAQLGAPLADLEAAFDGLPYALEGGLIYQDSTHWNRYLDPLVSHAIARALVSSPAAAKGPIDAGWLAREGSSLGVPRPDRKELRDDWEKRLNWAVWESGKCSPLLCESWLTALDDLRRLDPAEFAAMPLRKEASRKLVQDNAWTRASAGEFDRRWAFGLAHAAETYRRAGELGRALMLFDEALRGVPEMRSWNLYKALALRGLGRRVEADRLLANLAAAQPRLPEVAAFLSRPQAASTDYELAPAPPAGPPPAALTADFLAQRNAEDLETAGRIREALAVLRPALRREEIEDSLLLTTLRVALAIGDRPLIQECVARARGRRLPPRRLALVADALRRLGRIDEALALFDEALALAPRDPGLLKNKGVLAALAGRPWQAQAALERAIALDPDQGDAYLTLGALRAGMGDVKGARRAYAAGLTQSGIRKDVPASRRLREALAGTPTPR